MKDITNVTNYYNNNSATYSLLANKVSEILKENLAVNNIQYHSVTGRLKTLESYTKKSQNEKYKNPTSEIKDIAGIRVITYLESDVKKVCDIVENLFQINTNDSINKAQLLGSDKLGYRSVHYIAKFDRNRCKLPENIKFKRLPFEIQVRSLLQHAWAEIEHDRNYKFSGKLPTELERRFYLVAGMLEVADREFVSIAQEIDKYKSNVVEQLNEGALDIEINTTSLIEYLSKRFDKMVNSKVLIDNYNNESSTEMIKELSLFGISNLQQLDEIIPPDFQEKSLKFMYNNTYIGCIRDILIINNAKKYFDQVWREKWDQTEEDTVDLWKSYKLNIENIETFLEDKNISIY